MSFTDPNTVVFLAFVFLLLVVLGLGGGSGPDSRSGQSLVTP